MTPITEQTKERAAALIRNHPNVVRVEISKAGLAIETIGADAALTLVKELRRGSPHTRVRTAPIDKAEEKLLSKASPNRRVYWDFRP